MVVQLTDEVVAITIQITGEGLLGSRGSRVDFIHVRVLPAEKKCLTTRAHAQCLLGQGRADLRGPYVSQRPE